MARQVDLVEQMIAQRVGALVIAPADSKALVPVVVKAQQAGIVVVNIDNRLDRDVLARARRARAVRRTRQPQGRGQGRATTWRRG